MTPADRDLLLFLAELGAASLPALAERADMIHIGGRDLRISEVAREIARLRRMLAAEDAGRLR